ncbi:unnamed protein product [Cylicocyclus nassatus]|uniref:Uncharacterized protein n=1 Tax=Cylicocyclus nassatus TaxID=53992 RepID=A0AA36HG01_CYLNA|nr:unnamed protein product [Cylicocyclus nassatus]
MTVVNTCDTFYTAKTHTGTHATCPCNGVVVEESDQKHCWEVVTREASTWVDADLACQTIGGHLGHPQGTMSDTVYRYVRSSYTKPVLTGIVAGSAEANLYAMVCPNNKFYGLLPKNTTFYQEATSTDTCAYFTTQSEKLTFASCTLDAHALCDRPMEKADYCNTVITCTTTTTTTSTSSTTAITFSTPSNTSTKTDSTLPTTTKIYAANLTTSANTSSTTTTTKPEQENVLTNTTNTTTGTSTSTTSTSTTSANMVTNTSSLTIPTKSGNITNTSAKPIWDSATNSTNSTASTTSSTPRISLNTTSLNITTTPSGAVVPVEEPAKCTKQGCGEHEWSIFGWCTDWRALLLLAALLLALFLLICLLHCCCKLCIDPCQVKRKKEEKFVKNETVKDPPVPKPKPTFVKKISEETFPRNSCYDVDQSSILPPPATVTQPVFVPVPVHHSEERALKKADPEIRFISPPKPDTVDVGVNTDPWPLEKESSAKKPVKADKVQVRQAPTVHAPLVEIDDYSADDPADDVSLHLEQWHSAERQPKSKTELPKGDIVNGPFVFMQNPKPRRSHSDEPKRASAPQAVNEQEMGPQPNSGPVRSNVPVKEKPARASRSFRSPPPSQRTGPAPTIRSPQQDNATNEQRRIPSPPKCTENTEPLKRDAPRSRDSDNRKSYNGGGAAPTTENDTTRPKEKRPPPSPRQIAEESRRKRSNDTKDMIPNVNSSLGPDDSAKKARSRRKVFPTSKSRHRPLHSREERPVIIPYNHHFAPNSSDSSAGGTTWRSTSSRNVSDSGSPTLPRGHVSMRNPRGRMGGVVRAGGGGGETPVGWKPWSKASSSLSQKQQFLADD